MRWNKRKLLPWLLAPLLGAAAAYAVGAVDVRRQWAILAGGDPVIECPETLALPEQEVGRVAVARFVLANRGRGELVVDEIRTNCSCSGLEQEIDGEFVRLESLRVKPRDEVKLAVRISVRGRVGAPLRNTVTFRTNDPTRPTADVAVLIPNVTGGIVAVPDAVVFSSVPVGGKARQTFEVRDTTVPPRRVQSVGSSQPERFAVRLIPPEAGADRDAETAGGNLLGRVEVVLQTREAGPVDGLVIIQLDDPTRPPDRVPVTGRVAPLVEALPPAVVLPRLSEAGSVYWARCLCRSTEGKPLKLALEKAPAGISAAVLGDAKDSSMRINPHRMEARPGEARATRDSHASTLPR
jgi:hypothetical protein